MFPSESIRDAIATLGLITVNNDGENVVYSVCSDGSWGYKTKSGDAIPVADLRVREITEKVNLTDGSHLNKMLEEGDRNSKKMKPKCLTCKTELVGKDADRSVCYECRKHEGKMAELHIAIHTPDAEQYPERMDVIKQWPAIVEWMRDQFGYAHTKTQLFEFAIHRLMNRYKCDKDAVLRMQLDEVVAMIERGELASTSKAKTAAKASTNQSNTKRRGNKPKSDNADTDSYELFRAEMLRHHGHGKHKLATIAVTQSELVERIGKSKATWVRSFKRWMGTTKGAYAKYERLCNQTDVKPLQNALDRLHGSLSEEKLIQSAVDSLSKGNSRFIVS